MKRYAMKAHGAYTSSEAATYDADRAIEPLWHIENGFVGTLVSTMSDAHSVLDVPVGTGRFLDLYQGKTITGIDLSAAMLEEAGRRTEKLGLPQVNLQQGSITALPFADNQFDLVVSWRMFHLLPPNALAPALSELSRVCCGTLCIQTYERASLPARLLAKARRWQRRTLLIFRGKQQLTPWSHIKAYAHSREAIEQAAFEAGITVPVTRSLLGNYEGTHVMALVWTLKR